MGFYLRFIVTKEGTPAVSLVAVEAGMRARDARYRLDRVALKGDVADLVVGDEIFAEVEINRAGSDLFDEEIQEFVDLLDGYLDAPGTASVLAALNEAKCMVVVKAHWGDRPTEATLSAYEPMWDWLFSTQQGILQVDNEGFYDRHGLLLDVES